MMRWSAIALTIAAWTVIAGAAAQQTSGPIEVETWQGSKTITPDWAAINGQKLGERGNPVRVHRPQGQHAYLRRLVCADGGTPDFRRVGSFGAGPYTTIIDGYEVDCAGTKSLVFMDMYHPGYVERRPVPGFTIRDSP